MTDETLHRLWNTYQHAWSDVPAEERDRLLRSSLAQDVAFTSPDSDDRGIDRMVATITEFQSQFNGCYFRSTLLRQQHGQLLAAWTMFDRNDVALVNGHSYARFDEQQGRITHLAGFWKL
ncbi:hypothetical protein [Silvibacterium acidisoli]|uniref:hypothetical protein n=1 Tax=Acidobacteriaceae bacterium ZG23-2 TaxID=2883246 RepID=UPI00406D007C